MKKKKPAEPNRDRRASVSLLVLEARKPSALVVAVGSGHAAELILLAADLLVKLDLRKDALIVGSSQRSSLVAKSSLGVWHLTSSLGAAYACGGWGCTS